MMLIPQDTLDHLPENLHLALSTSLNYYIMILALLNNQAPKLKDSS